jgi:hypothetical protein
MFHKAKEILQYSLRSKDFDMCSSNGKWNCFVVTGIQQLQESTQYIGSCKTPRQMRKGR